MIKMIAEQDWTRHWPMKRRVREFLERKSDRSLSPSLSLSSQPLRHSRSQRLHHRVLLCRCPHKALRTSSQIRQWRWGAQERRDRKGERGQAKRHRVKSPRETSGKSKGSVTTNDRADGGIVLSAAASFRKDEMMKGGLYVIDGIDVVATLVSEEDAWHIRGSRDVHTRNSVAGHRTGIDSGCGLGGSGHVRGHLGQ